MKNGEWYNKMGHLKQWHIESLIGVTFMVRTYTKKFKLNACNLVLKDNCSCSEVAKCLGINKGVLYRWIDEYKTFGDEAFVGHGNARAVDTEVYKLRKENERLRAENAILKNAAAYFAQQKGK